MDAKLRAIDLRKESSRVPSRPELPRDTDQAKAEPTAEPGQPALGGPGEGPSPCPTPPRSPILWKMKALPEPATFCKAIPAT